MSRLRCRIGLHRWRAVVSQRIGWHTVECHYCRYRYSTRLAEEAPPPTEGRLLSRADPTPS